MPGSVLNYKSFTKESYAAARRKYDSLLQHFKTIPSFYANLNPYEIDVYNTN
jgi:hypothetical protein